MDISQELFAAMYKGVGEDSMDHTGFEGADGGSGGGDDEDVVDVDYDDVD